MVGSLFMMHIFLASANLTTWEYISWDKISYLKVWPKKYGSPFSKPSKWENIKIYFTKMEGKRKWKMPSKFPDIVEQGRKL